MERMARNLNKKSMYIESKVLFALVVAFLIVFIFTFLIPQVFSENYPLSDNEEIKCFPSWSNELCYKISNYEGKSIKLISDLNYRFVLQNNDWKNGTILQEIDNGFQEFENVNANRFGLEFGVQEYGNYQRLVSNQYNNVTRTWTWFNYTYENGEIVYNETTGEPIYNYLDNKTESLVIREYYNWHEAPDDSYWDIPLGRFAVKYDNVSIPAYSGGHFNFTYLLPNNTLWKLDPEISACGDLVADTSYTLTANVQSEETCFSINANNVLLDCNGYKINYSVTAKGYAINNSGGFDNITVKNCWINQTGSINDATAIYIVNSNLGLIQNNTIYTYTVSSRGIYYTYTENYNITQNTINSTSDSNIAGYEGLADNVISYNDVYCFGDNHKVGIYLYNSAANEENKILHNNIEFAGYNGRGIYVDATQKTLVINNTVTITGELNKGIDFTENYYGYVENNTIYSYSNSTGADFAALYVASTSSSYLKNNQVWSYNKTGNGMHFKGGSNTTFINNTINVTGEKAYGIHVRPSTNTDINKIINCSVKSIYYAFALYYANNTNVTDSVFDSMGTDDVYFNDSGRGTVTNFFNVTFGSVAFQGSTYNNQLNVYWYLDAYVNDSNDNPVVGADVIARNNLNNIYFNTTTDSNGLITRQTVLEYMQNATQKYMKTNYTINATDGSAWSQTEQVNITGNLIGDNKIVLTLEADTIKPAITINSPTNKTYNNASLDYNVTLDEDGSWCGFSHEGSANITMTELTTTTFGYTNSSLSDGHFNITFYCNDTSNNYNKTSIAYTRDATKPYFTKTENQSIYTNQSAMLDIDATDNLGFHNYSVNDTTLFSINGTGGLVNISALSVKFYWLNITINDTANNINSTIIYVNVSEEPVGDINAPYFTDAPNLTIYNNQSAMLDIDADDDVAFDTYSINDTTNFEINSTGGITNITALTIKTYWINVTINDTSNNLNTTIVYINVTDWNLESPYFVSISNQEIYNNESLGVDFDATDNDNNFDTWSVNDTDFEINSTGYLKNATELSIQVYNLNITINDTENKLNSTIITVTVNNYDLFKPYFTDISDISVYSNESVGQDFDAVDDEGNFDTWAVNDTTNFEINSTGYIKNITELSIKTYYVNVSINDTQNNVNSSVISITVSNYDLFPPYFTDTGNLTMYNNASATLDLNATDDEGNFDCFAVNDTYFEIDCTGALENTTSLSIQTYWLNITINDTLNNLNSTIIYVNVTAWDTESPYFTDIVNISVYDNSSVGVDLNATDVLAFDTWSINDTTNFKINDSGYLKNITFLAVKKYWIEITINDTSNNINTTTIFVNVTNSTNTQESNEESGDAGSSTKSISKKSSVVPMCGDGICSADYGEDIENCPQDCPYPQTLWDKFWRWWRLNITNNEPLLTFLVFIFIGLVILYLMWYYDFISQVEKWLSRKK